MERQDTYSLNSAKELFIRIPENYYSDEAITLKLDSSLAGKTVKIIAVNNHNTPFEDDVIADTCENSEIDYYGDAKKDWDAKDTSHYVVEGNPDCSYSECTYECHVVSCPVHQGYASSAPMRVGCIRSRKLHK